MVGLDFLTKDLSQTGKKKKPLFPGACERGRITRSALRQPRMEVDELTFQLERIGINSVALVLTRSPTFSLPSRNK
jgi:hypothetical protein